MGNEQLCLFLNDEFCFIQINRMLHADIVDEGDAFVLTLCLVEVYVEKPCPLFGFSIHEHTALEIELLKVGSIFRPWGGAQQELLKRKFSTDCGG